MISFMKIKSKTHIYMQTFNYLYSSRLEGQKKVLNRLEFNKKTVSGKPLCRFPVLLLLRRVCRGVFSSILKKIKSERNSPIPRGLVQATSGFIKNPTWHLFSRRDTKRRFHPRFQKQTILVVFTMLPL